jgi:hypothetical protein
VSAQSCTILSITDLTTPRGSVHGLNLTVPEDAKETIKPWDERESTEKFAESNVDDQVRYNQLMLKSSTIGLLLFFAFPPI